MAQGAQDVRQRKGKAKAKGSTSPHRNGDDTATPGALRRHENRGHRLFRSTPSSNESKRMTPLLRALRYTQGITTAVTAVSIAVWHSRVESAWFLLGALATSTAAKTLKGMIKDPRPEGSPVKTHGMPSTHSATVAFMACYVLGYPVIKLLQGGAGALSPWEWCYGAGLAIFLPLVMWSRVALGVHTTRQVVVGGTLGLVVANGAWQIWNRDTAWAGGRPLGEHVRVSEWDRLIAGYKEVGVRWLKVGADQLAMT